RGWIYVVPPYFTACSHIQPQQVHKSMTFLYCGVDNEHQFPSRPTYICLIRSARNSKAIVQMRIFASSQLPKLSVKITKSYFPSSTFLNSNYFNFKFTIQNERE